MHHRCATSMLKTTVELEPMSFNDSVNWLPVYRYTRIPGHEGQVSLMLYRLSYVAN